MADLAKELAEVRALLEKEVVDCLGGKGTSRREPDKKITGKVPNPAFAALLEVFRYKCPGAGNKKGHWHYGEWYPKDMDCGHYITRSWEGWPPKALEGALAYGVYRIIAGTDASPIWAKTYATLMDSIHTAADTREAALAALLAALEGR